MGVDKDVSHPSERVTAEEQHRRIKDNRDGPVRAEALHRRGLCDICDLARRFHGHRAVPRSVRWASAHHAGVPDGGQEHELSACLAVAHRLIPVRRGDHRRTGRDLHSRHSVLVHRLCLRSGPPHSCTRFHSGVVQAAALQRLRGTLWHVFMFKHISGVFPS